MKHCGSRSWQNHHRQGSRHRITCGVRCCSRRVLYFFELIAGRYVGFWDGLNQRIEAEWSSRTPFRTDLNDLLSVNGVIQKPFNKSRVNEVTHLEVTGINLRRDDASSKLLHVVRMWRELTFSQGQHSRQVHRLMGYAIKALTQHTHELEPVILYNFCQTVIILDSNALGEEPYGGDLIDG